MTLSVETIRVQALGTNATGQAIPFTFTVQSEGEVYVIAVSALGIETPLQVTSDYVIVLNDDGTGTVTTVAAWPVTSTITVYRKSTVEQSLDLQDGGDFSASSLMQTVDQAIRLIAEVEDEANRCIQLSPVDPDSASMVLPNAVVRANSGNGSILGFDGNGDLTCMTAAIPAGTFPVGAFGQYLVMSTTPAAAVAALGLGTAAVLNTGTSAGHIPRWDDFGTAAFKTAGSAIGNLPVLGTVSGVAALPAVNGSLLTGLPSPQGLHTRMGEIYSQGAQGGSSTGPAWNNRVLTYKYNSTAIPDGIGVTLNNDGSFTISTGGTFRVVAKAPCYGGGFNRLRIELWNGSAWVLYANGGTYYAPTGMQMWAEMDETLYPAASTGSKWRISHYITTSVATSGLGIAQNLAGQGELYARVDLWKIT